MDDLGGTMRLGSYACRLASDSLAFRLYGEEIIHERHRHRYEFNCTYEKALTDAGLRIVGRSLDGKFVEIVELPGHPWYLAVQFHPEFKSKPLRPHPLFAGFAMAVYKRKMALQGIAINVTAIETGAPADSHAHIIDGACPSNLPSRRFARSRRRRRPGRRPPGAHRRALRHRERNALPGAGAIDC